MYSEENRILPVTPEWSAEFLFIYEVTNCANGWGLILHGPAGKKVERFENYISHCSSSGDSDEDLMQRLSLADDGRHLTIKTPYEGDWLVDLETGNLRKLPPTEEEIRQRIAFEEAHIRGRGNAWEVESKDLPSPGSRSHEESLNQDKKRGCGCFLILLAASLLGKFGWMILNAV